METLLSETRLEILVQKNTCRICYDDDIEADQMFYVALCGHWFCVECVKRHIEVSLLDRSVPRCLHYGCKSRIALRSCAHLLTPKLKSIWQRKIIEESIPVKERFYCTNPKCSALISVNSFESMGCCSKCGELFCINCKVAWHSNLSCKDYKRLGSNPTTDDMLLKVLANQKMWRQCKRCQHMIELSEGCIHVTCRCGYEFCYTCGGQWMKGGICNCFFSTNNPPLFVGFLIILVIIIVYCNYI